MRPLPSAKGWMVSNWACAIAACTRTGRSCRPMNVTRAVIAAGTSSASGAMWAAWRGEEPSFPTHTRELRSCPASCPTVPRDPASSSRCIARIALRFRVSASRSAASIVRTFASTAVAFALRLSCSSARASRRAPTVRSSIREEDADSVRSRMELMGPTAALPAPSRANAKASYRTSARSASETAPPSSRGIVSARSARGLGSTTSYGPVPRARALRDVRPSSETCQNPGLTPTGGTGTAAGTVTMQALYSHLWEEV